jgi:iron complex outermembrane receptor protein
MNHLKMKLTGMFLVVIISSGYSQQPDTAIQLKEFEIIDIRPDQAPFPVARLATKDAEEISVRDAGDFLRSVPNINGIRKGGIAIDPVIRGFKYSQLNVQINNGQKIEGGCPNRMDNPVSHVEIDDMREIEVYKGPYALRYGPSFGGIVNLKTFKPMPESKFTVHAGAMMGYESNWNGMKQQVFVKGGNRKFYFYLSGNHKDYGNYSDGNGKEVPSEFKRYNYSVQAGFTPIKDQQFLLSFEESYGRDVAFPTLPMDEREDNTRLMSIDYKGRLSKTINHLHLKAYHSKVHHIMDNKERPFSDTVVAISEIKAINWGYRAEAGIYTGLCQLYVGTDFENIDKDGDRTKYFIMQPTLPVKEEMLWDNANIRNFGFFAEWNKSLDPVKIVAAVRLDLNSATSGPLHSENMMGMPVYRNDSTTSDFVNFSFSAGATWDISDRFALSLSFGRGTRSPDMNERFITLLPIGYDPYDYLGNPQLKPETNNQADLKLRYNSQEAGTLDAGIFYSYVNRFISGVLVPETVAKPQTKGVYGVKQFENIGDVWLTGFELSWASPESWDLGITADAAYTYGVNPETEVYIIQNGEVTGKETVKNDALPEIPPFEGSITVFYKFLKGKLVPRASVRMVALQGHISQSYEETETPGFVNAGLSFTWQAHPVLSISGGVNNIFNQPYYEHLNRRMIGTKENLYEPGRSFFVVLRFKV